MLLRCCSAHYDTSMAVLSAQLLRSSWPGLSTSLFTSCHDRFEYYSIRESRSIQLLVEIAPHLSTVINYCRLPGTRYRAGQPLPCCSLGVTMYLVGWTEVWIYLGILWHFSGKKNRIPVRKSNSIIIRFWNYNARTVR